MKKDLVTLMDGNRRSLRRTRGSRLMELNSEDKLTQEQKRFEDEDENPVLEEMIEVEE